METVAPAEKLHGNTTQKVVGRDMVFFGKPSIPLTYISYHFDKFMYGFTQGIEFEQ